MDLGRRLRAAVARRPARDLHRHARLRDGAAAQVRRLAGRGDRGHRANRHLPGQRRHGRTRTPLRAPHLHRPARAPHAARPPGFGRGLLGMSAPAIWQQVEFGSYAADLPLWLELAEEANGPVLELGAGSGRVALHLAEHGHQVIALERDPDLIAELERSAAKLGGSVTAVRADLASTSEFELPAVPSLAIGPLHVVQVLDSSARPALLGRLLQLIAPGGQVALTVVDETPLLRAGAAATQILPDMREVDGWVYSSEPLWVQVGEDALTVRRVRERVSPEGAMQRSIHDEVLNRLSPARLEIEAEEVGFRPAGRRQISSGPNEADSTVVLLQ